MSFFTTSKEKDKRSFFEKLAGLNDPDTLSFGDMHESPRDLPVKSGNRNGVWSEGEENEEAELSIDMYHTENEIIIEAFVAGVKPDNLGLTITRDMVIIRGKREGNTHVGSDDYFHRELYWGNFSRSIALPHEIEVEESEAIEKHGLLIIRLPKIDKHRQTKLKVKSI